MTTNKKARSKRGLGRLYKRGKGGKELPATSNVNSPFYLEYRINGKRNKICLTDEAGNKVTDRKEAEKIRLKIVAPLLAEDEESQLKNIKAKLETAHAETIQAYDDSTPALKLSEAWGEYYKSHNRPESGASTLNRYEACINAFNGWAKQNFPDIKTLREVTTEHAEAYADHLEDKKLSPSSFNIYLNALAMVWAVLEKKARIKSNPFAWDRKIRTGIQRKNIKAESIIRKKRPLTLEEVNTVIEKAEGDYRTLLIILACTGQRLVDGLKLQWEEIDLQQGIITLMPKKTAKRTGKQVLIPILPQLREELESLMHDGCYVLPELVKAYDKDPSIISKQIRSIFTSSELTAHKNTDLQTVKAIVETGAHSLRHSFVTIARLAGIPDAMIMQITGHQSAEMIDHYTSFDKNQVAKLAATIPNTLAAPKTKDPMPEWIAEKLKTMAEDNWEQIKTELLEVK